MYKIKVFPCEYCGKEFSNSSGKSRHKIKCVTVSNFNRPPHQNQRVDNSIINNDVELNMDNTKNKPTLENCNNLESQLWKEKYLEAHEMIKSLVALAQSNSTVIEKSVSAVEKSAMANEATANVANKSMNILKYMQINHPNTPPLKKLNKKEAFSMLGYDNPNMSEKENEHYVKLVLANYENKNIANFFGDLIVNYYVEDDVKDVRFWTSDVARLCFCVMQTINKEGKTEWMKDKSGT
jgi:hypothetical protein